jgi:hypothetical protein
MLRRVRRACVSIQEVTAEELAKLFHHYREALAEDFHGLLAKDASLSWDRTLQNERRLMVAAGRLALLELAATSRESERKYFAKPGEADWGC